MSKSSSIGILPIIIGLTVAYNLFFDDDDEEKKKEVIKEPASIEDQLPISEDFKKLGVKFKVKVETMIDNAKKDYLESNEDEEKQVEVSPGPGPLVKSQDPEPDEEELKPEPEPEEDKEEPEGRVL